MWRSNAYLLAYNGTELATERRCRSVRWRGNECITSWKFKFINAPWQHVDGQIVDVHSTCMPMHMHRHNIQSMAVCMEMHRFEIMSKYDASPQAATSLLH